MNYKRIRLIPVVLFILCLVFSTSVEAASWTPAEMETMIDSLSDDSTSDDIAIVVNAFRSLTDAQQLQVGNASKLQDMSSALFPPLTSAENSLDTNGNVTEGYRYTFELSEEESQITISVQYDDAVPVITITDPNEETFVIGDSSAELSNSHIDASILRMANLIQIDVNRADLGKWTIRTSKPVHFTSMTYAGSVQTIDAPEMTTTEQKPEITAVQSKKSNTGNMISLIIIAVVGAAAFIYVPKLMNGEFAKKKSEKETPGTPIRAAHKRLTKEEENAALQEELARFNFEDDQYDDPLNDHRLFFSEKPISKAEIENDSTIREIKDDPVAKLFDFSEL